MSPPRNRLETDFVTVAPVTFEFQRLARTRPPHVDRSRASFQGFPRACRPSATSRRRSRTASCSCCSARRAAARARLLRAIAGLTTIDHGRIVLHGRDVTNLGTRQREVGFVFQNYALFRHMTVADNIEFALRARRVRAQRAAPPARGAAQARCARRLRPSLAERAVGRPTAARRARARARARAARVVARRAVRCARRKDSRGAAARDSRDSASRRYHDDARHARPGRSLQHGRPHRRHGPRPAAGGRRAARALSAARHAVRRAVPRRRQSAARPVRLSRRAARRVVFRGRPLVRRAAQRRRSGRRRAPRGRRARAAARPAERARRRDRQDRRGASSSAPASGCVSR